MRTGKLVFKKIYYLSELGLFVPELQGLQRFQGDRAVFTSFVQMITCCSAYCASFTHFLKDQFVLNALKDRSHRSWAFIVKSHWVTSEGPSTKISYLKAELQTLQKKFMRLFENIKSTKEYFICWVIITEERED